jgi:DMSO reductase family type II enzyme chaperone
MFDPPPMQTQFEGAATAAARARAYALLANGWRYPDESVIKLFADGEPCAFWPEAADVLALPDLEELRASHARLFGHSVRGSCPPYELEYGRSEIIQQTAELADLNGFYHAFGMSMSASAFERPDHVAVECEFLSVLCAKEAWGREQNHGVLTEACVDAQRLFLRDHVAWWLPTFAHRVSKAEPEGFYGTLARLAAAFLAGECQAFDIEVGPQWLELRPMDPGRDAAMDCDASGCGVATANQLVQIGIESQTSGVQAE